MRLQDVHRFRDPGLDHNDLTKIIRDTCDSHYQMSFEIDYTQTHEKIANDFCNYARDYVREHGIELG